MSGSTDRLRRAMLPPGSGADIAATRHAGIARLEPQTHRAEAWLRTAAADDSVWDGDALLVEMRYFAELADGAIAAGLTFERDALPN